MAYNQKLAERVRHLLAGQPGIVEKSMFGGLTFMVMDNMCCGVLNNDLVVRVGPEHYQEALADPSARPMDFTGRPLKGMLYIGPKGCKTEKELKAWVDEALSFVVSLPPRAPRKAKRQ
ncbi:MAG: TfoX/Sxy family protein [Chloroflexi bacterium]|nr:TfoX/Sxy family protein [Chloroflexota bacterium]